MDLHARWFEEEWGEKNASNSPFLSMNLHTRCFEGGGDVKK